MTQKNSPSSGFGMIEVMMSVGLLAVVVAAIMSLSNVQNKTQNQSNTTFQADAARRNLMSLLNNPTAWSNTVAYSKNSPSLDCLKNGGTCANGAGGPILYVLDGGIKGGNVVYDWVNNDGLNQNGTKCSGFNAAPGKGSDLCPLQFQVSWVAVCSSANCPAQSVQPQISVKAEFNAGTAAKAVNFNSKNYSSTFFQQNSGLGCQWADSGAGLTDLSETCAAAVGIGTASPGSLLTVLSAAGHGRMTFDEEGGTPYADAVLRSTSLGTGIASIITENSAQNWQFRVDPSIQNSLSLFDATKVSNRLIITTSGLVGIGTTTPGANLDVVGTIQSSGPNNGTIQSGSFLYTSDSRLKHNIEPIESNEGLAIIKQLTGVRFRWNSNNADDVGLIAQEVQKTLPELVVKNPQSGLLSVKYGNLVAPIIEAIKNLSDKFDKEFASSSQANARVEKLELLVNDLQKKVDSLEKANLSLQNQKQKAGSQ